MQLVERGVLDLDRPMRAYAGFAEFCEQAGSQGGIFFRDYACDERQTMRTVLGMTANGAPGSRFLYNPVSFSWASRPIAEVAGVPFSTLVDSLILRPAGMTSSQRVHRRLPLRPDLAARLALPHRIVEGRVLRSDQPPPQGDGAAGGVIASAADLARFDRALMTRRLVSAASRERMWAAHRSPDGTVIPYGIGWFVQTLESDRVVYHTGLWEDAYSALYLKIPSRGLTLILLANSDGLRWPSGLDEAAVERSPFVGVFRELFLR
jgi:CubicO group peptidase (beta-lactamase class C family)